MAQKLATYRWMAREIHNICSFGPYTRESCPAHWQEKARKVDAAPRTIDGVIAALVNYDWMIETAIHSPRNQRQAQKILAILAERTLVENLPEKVGA